MATLPSPRRLAALAALTPLGLSACGGSDDGANDAAAPVTAAAASPDATSATAPPGATTAGDNGASSDAGVPGGPRGFGTQGTVIAIDGAALTVESQSSDGTLTQTEVTTSEATAVVALVEGGLGDLAVGDTVTVVGESADDGTLTAASISTGGVGAGAGGGFPGGGFPGGGTPPGGSLPEGGFPGGSIPDLPGGTLPGGSLPDFGGDTPPGGSRPEGFPGGPGGGFTFGEITEVTGAGLAITADDGTITDVVVDATTVVTVSQELAVADVAVGDVVTVVTGDDGSATAITIRSES